MPVQVLVTAHGVDWSPSSYVLSHGPSSSTQDPAAGQVGQGPQAGEAAAAAVGDPGSTTLGPFSAVAVRRAQGVVCLKSFAHSGGLNAYLSSAQPFDVVLQEQVGCVGAPHQVGGLQQFFSLALACCHELIRNCGILRAGS